MPASTVRWNGSGRTTTFVSATGLTARIPASDLAVGGPLSITVFTPAPGGGASAAMTLTVTPPTGASLRAPRLVPLAGP